MTDATFSYDYWNDLLEGKKPPFHDGEPQGGCFSMKGRDESKVPVRIDKVDKAGAIDLVDGTVMIWVNGKAISEAKMGDVWMACGRTAVTFEVYEFRMANGRWPDEIDTSEIKEASEEFFKNATLGGNNPPPEAVHELLPYTLAQVADWFKKMGEKFTKAEEITAAADHAHALRTLISKAKKVHAEEKKPHLEAGKAVDAKYLRPCDAADKLLTTMTRAVATFEATQRKVREAEQERAAKEAAAAAKALEQVAAKPEISPEEKQARVDALTTATAAVEKAAGPIVHKSSTGKRGFKVTEVPIATVADQDALYAAVRDRAEVKECLRALAQKDLDSGTLHPGVVKTEGLKGK